MQLSLLRACDRALLPVALLVAAPAATAQFTPALQYSFTSSATALDSIEDLDGDGVRELVTVGPQTYVLSSPTCTGCGRAVVEMRSGQTGALIRRVTLPLNFLGGAIATLDDVDGDGWEDFVATVVQAPVAGPFGNPVDQSRAYVFSGRPFQQQLASYVLSSFGCSVPNQPVGANNMLWGSAVAAVGNLDGVPGSEIAIGAPDYDAVPSADLGLIEIRDWTGTSPPVLLNGAAAGERFGAAVSSVGFCSAGNPTDFVVGAPGAGTNGEVRRIDGTMLTPVQTWSGVGSGYGSSLAATQGTWPFSLRRHYFATGAPGGSGLVDVRGTLSGACGAESFLVDASSLPMSLTFSNIGFSVSAVGVLAGNSCAGGIPEEWVAVGAPDLGAGTGSYVILALDDATATPCTPQVMSLRGGGSSATFGFAVTELDDVDGDGQDDFAVADPLAGVVRVF